MSFKYVRDTISDAAKTLSVVVQIANKFCELDPTTMIFELELPDPIGYELVKKMNNLCRNAQISVIKHAAKQLYLLSKEPYIETVVDNQVYLDVKNSYVADSTDSIIYLAQKSEVQGLTAEDIIFGSDPETITYRAGPNFIILPNNPALKYVRAKTNSSVFLPYFQLMLTGADVTLGGENFLELEYEYFGKDEVLVIKKLGDSENTYISESSWTVPPVNGSTVFYVQSLVTDNIV